ncbi:MAG: hypothetical protein GX051_08720 [Clostridiales bacterium]|nr:hypothetical protein [Clostridiales bacterium]
MATCPKCGYKLKIKDYKPECPSCGVNLIYYNMEERLAADADKAEAEHIQFQPRIDRLKFAFIGTKMSIVRIICCLLPIGMLFLPLCSINVNLPYSPIKASGVSVLTIAMDVVAKLNFDALLKLFGSEIIGKIMIFYALAIVMLLLAAVIAIVNLLLLMLSASPRGFKRNFTFCVLGVVFSALSFVFFTIMNGELNSTFPGIYTGSSQFGIFCVIAAFIILFVVNLIIKKQNVPVKYKDLSEFKERLAKNAAEREAHDAALKEGQKEAVAAE